MKNNILISAALIFCTCFSVAWTSEPAPSNITLRDTLLRDQFPAMDELRNTWNTIEELLLTRVKPVPAGAMQLLQTTAAQRTKLYTELKNTYVNLRTKTLSGDTEARKQFVRLINSFAYATLSQRILDGLARKERLYARFTDLVPLIFKVKITIGQHKDTARLGKVSLQGIQFSDLQMNIYITGITTPEKLASTIEHELTHIEQFIEKLVYNDLLAQARELQLIDESTRAFITALPQKVSMPLSVSSMRLGDIVVWSTQNSQADSSFGMRTSFEYEADIQSLLKDPDHIQRMIEKKHELIREKNRQAASSQNPPVSQQASSGQHTLFRGILKNAAYISDEELLTITRELLYPTLKTEQFQVVRNLLRQWARAGFKTGVYTTDSQSLTIKSKKGPVNQYFQANEQLIELVPTSLDVKQLYMFFILMLPTLEPAILLPDTKTPTSVIISQRGVPFIQRFIGSLPRTMEDAVRASFAHIQHANLPLAGIQAMPKPSVKKRSYEQTLTSSIIQGQAPTAPSEEQSESARKYKKLE